MISTFSFLFFFILCLKDNFYFRSFLWIDGFSLMISRIVFSCLFLIFSTFFNFVSHNQFYIYSFFFSMCFFLVFFSFVSRGIFYFLLFLEICAFPMSFLILNFSKDFDKFISVLFMFTFNVLGSLFFIIFSYKFYFFFRRDSFLLGLSGFYSKSFFMLLCFTLILLIKLPLIFFHFWLTKAHVSASGPCSIILAGLMLKLGSFGLIKFFAIFLILTSLSVSLIFSVTLFSCLFFCLLIFRFTDLKYVVACSSILHISLIAPLVLTGTSQGLVSSIFIMTGHGLISYYLFYLVSLIYEFNHSRSPIFIKSLESYSKTLTLTLLSFVFLNIGFPPFINFFREFIFCSSLFYFSYTSLLIFSLRMILSVFFSLYIVSKSLFGFKAVRISGFKSRTFILGSMFILFTIFTLPFIG